MPTPDATRFLPLLETDDGFDNSLPPGTLRNVQVLREVALAQGLERGALKAAADKAGTRPTNYHHSLMQALRRKERLAELRGRGIRPTPGTDLRQISSTYDKKGKLQRTSVQERPASGEGLPDAMMPGFAISKVSTFRGPQGDLIGQWVQERPEMADRWRAAEEAVQRLVERVPPVAPVPPPATVGSSRLLSQLTIADGHVGALGWQPETGAPNWDLKVARETMLAGSAFLIDTLPPAEEMLITILGDFQDTDGFLPLTPTSKHLLDVDGRFPKIADTAIEIIEFVVIYALKRYRRVRLVIKGGNHDPLAAFWLRKLFTRIFQNEPRVEVDQSLRNITVIEFGRSLVVLTHGDKIKMSRLPHVVACDFPEEWGRTSHRYGHTGHLHHEHELKTVGKERDGMLVYQHPTVSSRNVWAADLGLSAARQLVGHCYRHEGGLAGKLYFHPDMIERLAA
jgi:hypothetical protein